MPQPAARVTDMHVCPMVTPAVPPVPHVGGPIIGPGVPNVLIGGLPAAVLGDLCTCVGPPAPIVMGRHLLDLGMKPGPEIGRVLKSIYERQLDGRVTNLDEGLAAAREIIGAAQGRDDSVDESSR